MLIAFTLGITGSLAHCAGMCGPVSALLLRAAGPQSRFGVVFLHLGRLATYMLVGLLAGALGQGMSRAVHHGSGHGNVFNLTIFQPAQGALALAAAATAVYFALSILGWLPSPEMLMAGWIRRWGKFVRSAAAPREHSGGLVAFGLGMLWGLLPCGLVLAALFIAVTSTSAAGGMVYMLAFGLGTLPSLLAVRWLAGRLYHLPWPRYAAAVVLVLFGLQFAMRGLSVWGIVDHLSVGAFMLW